MTKLFATLETTAVSIFGKIHEVIDGAVEVSWEEAQLLMDGHGFTLVDPNPPAKKAATPATTPAKK